MAECEHDFQNYVSVDIAADNEAVETKYLKCLTCGLMIQRKGGQPRYTLATIPRNQFIVNCILDPQLIASHLNAMGDLVDDNSQVLVRLNAAQQRGLNDRARRIDVMHQHLKTLVCMSCEREIETTGGLCADCLRMVSKECVSCGTAIDAASPSLCPTCQRSVDDKLAGLTLDD